MGPLGPHRWRNEAETINHSPLKIMLLVLCCYNVVIVVLCCYSVVIRGNVRVIIVTL